MPFINWIIAHQAVSAGLGVGILDLIFALVPSWESNGIAHWAYNALKSLVVPKAA